MVDFGFFHCFSRRHIGAADYSDDLFILQSMLDLGFLLVPETVILAGETFDHGHQGHPIQFIQRRLSLTLLAPSELASHRKQFGKFAIEFDLSDGRKLGAVPVIYLPQPSPHGEDQALDAISATIMYRLREIFFVLSDLATLEHKIEGAKLSDRIRMHARSERDPRDVNVEAVRMMLEMLGADKQSFGDLAATCQVIFHLFYPTDKRRSDMDATSLNIFYYQQREWRIFSDIIASKNRRERALTDEEKDTLCDRDAFFSEAIQTTDPLTNSAIMQRRVDLCRVLDLVDGRPPCAFIRRIWIPPEVQETVTAIIRNSDCRAELRTND